MKKALGFSAFLLGSTLLADAAIAQNQGPPPGFHGGPPAHGAPQNMHPGFNHGFHGHFYHPNVQVRLQWNHVFAYHDRNVAHFSIQDRAMWTRGQWRHTYHHGHNGWWWYTNGAWFFYDEPVYPYPTYVSTDYAFDDDYSDTSPAPAGYVWYYCSDPAGYYPYVQSCHGPWQPVDPSSQQPPGYNEQGPQQGGPGGDDQQGPPPQGQYPQGPDQYQGQPNGPMNGPPPNYQNGGDDQQGPPPPGYNGEQGPPPGPNDQPPPR